VNKKKNEKFLTFFLRILMTFCTFLLFVCGESIRRAFLLCFFSFPEVPPLLPLFFKNKKNSESTQLVPLALFADSIKSSQKQRY